MYYFEAQIALRNDKETLKWEVLRVVIGSSNQIFGILYAYNF